MIWREIPGFPDYEAAPTGEIRRAKASQDWRVGRTIQPIPQNTRYTTVNLYRDGKMHVLLVHRLIASTFHGPPPFPGAQAAHQNGKRDDNRAENLAWMTVRDNARQRRLHGTALVGERCGKAKLTAVDVIEIRKRRANAEKLSSIARDFKITETTVSGIFHRRIWSHL
jgi:hypothetical protein